MDLSQLAIEPPEAEGYPFAIPTSPPLNIRLRSPQSAEVVSAAKSADFIVAANARADGAALEDWEGWIGDLSLAKDAYMAAAAIMDFGGMKFDGEAVTTEAQARKVFTETNGGRVVAQMIAQELKRIEVDFHNASRASSAGRDTSGISTQPQKTDKKTD